MKNENNINYADRPVNEASEWFIKLQDSDLSNKNYLDWQKWLEKSDANKRAFARAENCWKELTNLTELPWENKIFTPKGNRPINLLRRFAPIAATILIVFSVGIFIHNDATLQPEATTYQTARAEHKSVQLADGSIINLGARSIVNVNYSDAERHITLVRGEAVFDVAKNKARPFIVQVGKGAVTAIGTKFNIHSSAQDVTVTVLEGIVEVNPDLVKNNLDVTSLPRVSAGKAVSYKSNGHISEVVTTNVDAATSWEKGLLVRVDTPLANVIEDVNRYSSREIIIGDAALTNIRFTGTVLSEGIDNWLRGLSVAYPIKVLDSGHDAILLLKKEE
ncbi:MAG: FecR domain-containing protein [Emcibacter sp.]|nr:FecR domain-containing protein [Emcibacter sp.]